MRGTLTEGVWFEHPNCRAPRRYAASLALLAGLALVICTVVAAAAVSIGIARADSLTAEIVADRSMAVAALLGVIFAGWACAMVLATRAAPPGE